MDSSQVRIYLICKIQVRKVNLNSDRCQCPTGYDGNSCEIRIHHPTPDINDSDQNNIKYESDEGDRFLHYVGITMAVIVIGFVLVVIGYQLNRKRNQLRQAFRHQR